MELTENIKGVIRAAMRENKVTQMELGKHLGLSHVWVSKMLRRIEKNGLKTLSDEQVDKIEEKLGIELYVLVGNERKVSGAALRLSELGESIPELARVMDALIAVAETKSVVFKPTHFETEEMVSLGHEISRVVITHNNSPGKIAWEVLKLVSRSRTTTAEPDRLENLKKSVKAKPRVTLENSKPAHPPASKNQ